MREVKIKLSQCDLSYTTLSISKVGNGGGIRKEGCEKGRRGGSGLQKHHSRSTLPFLGPDAG